MIAGGEPPPHTLVDQGRRIVNLLSGPAVIGAYCNGPDLLVCTRRNELEPGHARNRGRIDMANEGYHEPVTELSAETRDMHRAIVSLMEELEAVDWYNQRVDACSDSELGAILAHNRDEEKEHASMILEWIRRRDPAFDRELRDYVFTDKPIAHG